MIGKVVLVTGASTGIGFATARLFCARGAKVYGTSRKPCEIDGVTMLVMDQTDGASVQAAIGELLEREGRLDILVNNAGMGIAGPVTDTAPEELQRQLEVNVVGVLRVIRAASDALVKAKGAIVNVSSVAGVIAIPFQSGYSASKFALESLSECLRAELGPLGVRVCLVEPGDTKTAFTANRVKIAQVSDAYQARFEASLARMEHDEQNGMPPESVAKLIVKMADRKRPPVRATVGLAYKALRTLKRFLPDRLIALIVAKLYG